MQNINFGGSVEIYFSFLNYEKKDLRMKLVLDEQRQRIFRYEKLKNKDDDNGISNNRTVKYNNSNGANVRKRRIILPI